MVLTKRYTKMRNTRKLIHKEKTIKIIWHGQRAVPDLNSEYQAVKTVGLRLNILIISGNGTKVAG